MIEEISSQCAPFRRYFSSLFSAITKGYNFFDLQSEQSDFLTHFSSRPFSKTKIRYSCFHVIFHDHVSSCIFCRTDILAVAGVLRVPKVRSRRQEFSRPREDWRLFGCMQRRVGKRAVGKQSVLRRTISRFGPAFPSVLTCFLRLQGLGLHGWLDIQYSVQFCGERMRVVLRVFLPRICSVYVARFRTR